jgi:hypothetical protein
MFFWINADNVELTDWIGVNEILMNLGPTETNDDVVVNTQEKASRIKPGLTHTVFKICHRPITLIRVVNEDFIVES